MKRNLIKNKLFSPNIFDMCAIVAVVLFIIAGVIVSLNRFWQYEVSFIDFGQYDQAIWRISRFHEPLIHHFIHGTINVLGDHVTPSVFLLAPLFWVTEKSEILLIAQAIIVGLSGYFLYDIGKVLLKNKLASFSILICYFFFVGLQNAVITEFHELTVMTLPLMIVFWSAVKKKWSTYFIALLITLGCKEVIFALGITIGIAIILLDRKLIKIGIATIALSVLWGLVAFKIIIPFYAKGNYLYSEGLPDGIINNLLAFVDHPLKRHTLLFSFLSFGFLPLLAPQFWLAILQDYTARFLPNFITRWDLGLHYNAQSAVLLAISSLFGLKYLLTRFKSKKLIYIITMFLLINAIFLYRFVLHGPFALAYNPDFYKQTSKFSFLDTIISKVPHGAIVATQNNLATRFTHQEVYLLTSNYEAIAPDYILIDSREGQSPNNYFGSGDLKGILEAIVKDIKYTIEYRSGEQILFKRIK